MRIVIDMQLIQLNSKNVNKAFLRSFIEQASTDNQVFLVFNGMIEVSSLEELIHEYNGLVKRENIKVWNWYEGQSEGSEIFKKWYFNQLQPDVILYLGVLNELIDFNAVQDINELNKSSLNVIVTNLNEDLFAKQCDFIYSPNEQNDIDLVKDLLNQICKLTNSKIGQSSKEISDELLNVIRHKPYQVQALAFRSIQDGKLNKGKHKLILDLTCTVNDKRLTGIQRVAINISRCSEKLLENNSDFEVIPAYRIKGCSDCFYKTYFKDGRYDPNERTYRSDIVNPQDGDIILFTDLNLFDYHNLEKDFKCYMNNGVLIYTILYDLIPVYYNYHEDIIKNNFKGYLNSIGKYNGVISISEDVKNQFIRYSKEANVKLNPDLKLDYFHLGSNVVQNSDNFNLNEEQQEFIKNISSKTTFLMVSTIEPRKKHEDVLDTFTQLWKKGEDINLVFVGRQGWLVEKIVKKINNHPQLNKHLFWINNADDDYLNAIYKASTAVIVASIIEGFGLSIVEGALQHKYLLLRDIPVFREVGRNGAYFFKSSEPKELAKDINNWLQLYKEGKAPTSDDVEILTWEESAHNLLKAIGVLDK